MTSESVMSRLLANVQEDERVLGVWMDTYVQFAEEVRVCLALRDEHVAAFYAERWDWLSSIMTPVFRRDTLMPHPMLVLLTSDGLGVWISLVPWGSIPEYPVRSPKVLFDRTGRLGARLSSWSPPERVDFRALDREAEDVWFDLWRMAVWGERDVAGELYALAGALRAYLSFVAATQGMRVDDLAAHSALSTLSHFNDSVRYLAPRDMALVIARLMSTTGRELGESLGWQYPSALEDVVESFWVFRGWPTWRRRNVSST